MPSKDLINFLFFSLISMLCALGSPRSHAQGDGALEPSTPCPGWEHEQESLMVEYLCVVSVKKGDERPLYVQNFGSETYRFLFSQDGLALVVESSDLAKLRASPAIRNKLLSELTADRIDVWHEDALYWWRWLQNSESSWSGKTGA
jgi:hypothetical protein